jgi:hypothetical protein
LGDESVVGIDGDTVEGAEVVTFGSADGSRGRRSEDVVVVVVGLAVEGVAEEPGCS